MISDLNSLNQFISQPQPQQQEVNPSSFDNYDFFKSQFDAFEGSPAMQQKVLAEMYAYNDPETKRKRQMQDAIQQAIAQILSGDQVPEEQPYNSNFAPLVQGEGPGGIYSASPQAAVTPDEVIMPNAQPTQEAPKSYGFASAPGELLGEGGALTPDSFLRSLIDPLVGAVSTGIINPGAALLKTAGGTISDLSQGKSLQDALANPANAIENQGQVIQDSGQYQKYLENNGDPLQDIANKLKPAATIASYAPIGGMGVGGAVKQGIATGAASGFGSSERGNEIGGTLLGAGTGAVVAPVVYGAGKLIGNAVGKLTGKANPLDEAAINRGADIEAGALGIDPTKLQAGRYQGVTGGEKLGRDVVQTVAEETGKTPTTRKGWSQAIENLTTSLKKELSDAPGDTIDLVPPQTEGKLNTILDNPIVKRFKAEVGNHTEELEPQVVQNFVKDVTDLGLHPNRMALHEIKTEIANNVNFQRTNFASEPNAQTALKRLWVILDDITKEGAPELSNKLDKLTALQTAQPFAAAATKKGTNWNVPVVNIKLPAGKVTEPARALIGKSVGKGTAPVANGIGTTLPTSSLITNLFGSKAGESSSMSTPTSGDFGSTPTGLGSSSNIFGDTISTNTDNSAGQSEKIKQLLLLGLSTGAIDKPTADAYLALLKGDDKTGPALGATQQTEYDKANQVMAQTQDLAKLIEENKQYFSPTNTAGRLQDIGGIFGTDSKRAEVANRLNIAVSQLVQSISGAQASDQEREFIKQQLPNLYMNPERAIALLKAQYDNAKVKVDYYNKNF